MKHLFAALLVLAALCSVSGAQAAHAKTDGVPAFAHVFVIVGENTDSVQVTKKNSPYLVGTIEPQAAWLTNDWATTHYSESNYVAMTSGQFTPASRPTARSRPATRTSRTCSTSST